jgi:hypothetical protein
VAFAVAQLLNFQAEMARPKRFELLIVALIYATMNPGDL